MLRISKGFLASNLISSSKSIVIDGVNSNNEVGKAKIKVKYFSGKNWKIVKSKILVKSKNHNFFLSS